jgi:hypothetical protein
MSQPQIPLTPADESLWLKQYYLARGAFSVAWVVAALTIGGQSPAGAGLLIIYPLWDAAANYVDGSRNGGLGSNRTQAFNVAVSLLVTLAVIFALTKNMNWVIGVIGVWAFFSGLLQLATAIRRWKTNGGQWVMILSGAQSALAGVFMLFQARMPAPPSIANVAGYAGFGAFYFLLSAVWLTVKDRRRS